MLGLAAAIRGRTNRGGGFHMDWLIQFNSFVVSTRFKLVHSDVLDNITQIIVVNGVPVPFLVLSYSDFVGWNRIEGDNAVWRFGSLRTGRASVPQLVGDLNRDEGAVVVDAISQGIHAVRPVGPPAGPAEYEPEEFIRCIENHQTPPAWSQALPATSRPTAEGAPISTPLVEFNPYMHSMERHPAAPGLTEGQLDNVPLVTVHPTAVPAVIGAVLLRETVSI